MGSNYFYCLSFCLINSSTILAGIKARLSKNAAGTVRLCDNSLNHQSNVQKWGCFTKKADNWCSHHKNNQNWAINRG